MTAKCIVRFRRLGALLIVGLGLLPAPLAAVTPDEMLKDPRLEARARDLSQLLRCVVCQNQSIDDSNAPLAHDLRVLLRERLTAGDTDKQALAFLVARYGNFVLLRPPVQANTLLLWLGPAIFLAIAAALFGGFLKRRGSVTPGEDTAPFSSEETAQLDRLLKEGTAR